MGRKEEGAGRARRRGRHRWGTRKRKAQVGREEERLASRRNKAGMRRGTATGTYLKNGMM